MRTYLNKEGKEMKKQCVRALSTVLFAMLFCLGLHSSSSAALVASQPDFPNAGLLVSADSVQNSIGEESLVIIDARTAGYETSHIPGAINVQFGEYLTWGVGLLPVADLESKLSAAGLRRGMTFVIYDNTSASFGAAGRIFWMLEYLGCNNVHILDGGWDKWVADGRPTETAVNPLPASTFRAIVKPSLKSKKWHIWKRLNDKDFTIIDSRTDEEYIGWQLYGEARGGHIPQAVQIPYAWYFNADKTVKSYSSIKKIFKAKGITTDKEVTAYCTLGIRSGFTYFLLRLMGYPEASNYDGSIAEWSATTWLPMEKARSFSTIVYPSWVKALIDYHKPGSTASAPPEYPYDRNHKYLIFETQWGTLDYATAYKRGHIPGAIHSDSDIYENGYPRWFLLPAADLHAAMGSMGITANTTVVVYSNSNIFAARLWWILKYAGVKDVRFLNGGYKQWRASGYPGQRKINDPVPAIFDGSVRPRYRATTNYVFSHYADTDTALLADVRSKGEYVGNTSGYSYLEAKGRIPNAIWASNADDSGPVYNDNDGTLRSYAEVKQIWNNRGITSTGASNLFDKEVIFYCGGGYRSSLAFLYAYLMGYKNIRNYSDGWEGWSTTYTEDSSCGGITPGWCQTPSGRPIVMGP
jgi:3-mercaptopyruvate sulfurtransferase SseA